MSKRFVNYNDQQAIRRQAAELFPKGNGDLSVSDLFQYLQKRKADRFALNTYYQKFQPDSTESVWNRSELDTLTNDLKDKFAEVNVPFSKSFLLPKRVVVTQGQLLEFHCTDPNYDPADPATVFAHCINHLRALDSEITANHAHLSNDDFDRLTQHEREKLAEMAYRALRKIQRAIDTLHYHNVNTAKYQATTADADGTTYRTIGG
jgi:hypothetical protein